MSLRLSIAVFVLVGAGGCESDDPLRPKFHPYGPDSPSDPVVARVGDEAIYLSRVEELSIELEMDPVEVLDDMVDMALLVNEAVDRGKLDNRAVQRIWKKVLVQRLLEDHVEAEVDENEVTQDEVRQFYIANYKNKGVVLEDAWRDIWMHIVNERRREKYLELVERLESSTRVSIDDENFARYLGAVSE